MATKTKKKKKAPPVKVPVKTLGIVRPPQTGVAVGNIRLQGKTMSARLAASITAISVTQTIEGASTLTITVSDWYAALLRSELLMGDVTLTFDGLDWMLVKTSKSGSSMTLTFEERAVWLLRKYDKPKKANRDKTTRAQFVRSLITEVKEARIPYSIPEVNEKQPINPVKKREKPYRWLG